jgi:Bacterial Ig-like domain (group 2)
MRQCQSTPEPCRILDLFHAPYTEQRRTIRAAYGPMRQEGTTLVLKLTIVAVSVLAAACNGKSPVAPSRPAFSNLLISGADAVLTGSSSNYTATATLSDGTTRSVTPTWSSSNGDVASVDNAGRLDGRAHGLTTLTATHDGIGATKSVQVVNDYRGTWVGTFVVNGCDAPPGVCSSYEIDYWDFPIELEVLQTGNDLSEIRAMFLLPSFSMRANLSGRVRSDGRLNLAGSSEVGDRRGSAWATFYVGAWDTTLSGRDAMTGRWAQRLSIFQPPSNEIMENELVTMTRTSTRP